MCHMKWNYTQVWFGFPSCLWFRDLSFECYCFKGFSIWGINYPHVGRSLTKAENLVQERKVLWPSKCTTCQRTKKPTVQKAPLSIIKWLKWMSFVDIALTNVSIYHATYLFLAHLPWQCPLLSLWPRSTGKHSPPVLDKRRSSQS